MENATREGDISHVTAFKQAQKQLHVQFYSSFKTGQDKTVDNSKPSKKAL